MYLLRRKSDGKYYTNPDYSGYCRARYGNGDEKRELWTDNLDECRPFRSVGGIRNSRGVNRAPPADWKNIEWFRRANNKIRAKWEKEQFEANYEIVEVTIITN